MGATTSEQIDQSGQLGASSPWLTVREAAALGHEVHAVVDAPERGGHMTESREPDQLVLAVVAQAMRKRPITQPWGQSTRCQPCRREVARAKKTALNRSAYRRRSA